MRTDVSPSMADSEIRGHLSPAELALHPDTAYRVVIASLNFERIETTITCPDSCTAVIRALEMLPPGQSIETVTVRVDALPAENPDDRPIRGGDDERERHRAEQHQKDTHYWDIARELAESYRG